MENVIQDMFEFVHHSNLCYDRVKARTKQGFGLQDINGWSHETTLGYIKFKSSTDAVMFKMVFHDYIVDTGQARGLVNFSKAAL
jgi:hypothetical protein